MLKVRITKNKLTLNSFTQVIPSSLFINHTLINFTSCYVVAPVKSYIKEPFIVPKV